MTTGTPATKTKHGFIDWDMLTKINPREADPFLPSLDTTLAELCAWGVDNGYSHLWVMPMPAIEPTREWFEAARGEWDLLPVWTLKGASEDVAENRLRSVSGWRQKH